MELGDLDRLSRAAEAAEAYLAGEDAPRAVADLPATNEQAEADALAKGGWLAWIDERFRSRRLREDEADILGWGVWSAYQVWVQARLAYLFALVLICFTVFAVTALMEAFFNVYLPLAQGQGSPAAALVVIFIPIATVTMAWAFDELVDLVADALNPRGGGAFDLRVALASVFHAARGGHAVTTVRYSTLVAVDVLLPVALEVVQWTGFFVGFFQYWSVIWAIREAVAYGFWLALGYAVAWLVLHAVCRMWAPARQWTDSLAAQMRKEETRMNHASTQAVHLNVPGLRLFHWAYDREVRRSLVPCAPALLCAARPSVGATTTRSGRQLLPDSEGEGAGAGGSCCGVPCCGLWNRLSGRYLALPRWVRFFVHASIVIGAVVLLPYSFMLGWVLLSVSLIMLARFAKRELPEDLIGSNFTAFIYVFTTLSTALFLLNSTAGTFVEGGHPVVTSPSSPSSAGSAYPYTTDNDNGDWRSFVDGYPICAMRFNDDLTALDLALLTDVAYGVSEEEMAQLTDDFFGARGAQLEYARVGGDELVTLAQVLFPASNTTVVAVRGTADTVDVAEDVHYYVGIALLQIVDAWVSVLNQLPESFVVWWLDFTSMDGVGPAPVYEELVDFVADVAASHPHVIVVGHSLGGALATVAGARNDVPAFSVSGPGVVWNRARFGVTTTAIDRTSITIKPDYDWVVRVDQQGGLVQDIECAAADPVVCHSATTTVCELYNKCGDAAGRDWSESGC